MTGQELKIVFIHDKDYLAAHRSLTLAQWCLPGIAKTFKSPAFWTIRVLYHSGAEKNLFCEITSYHAGETEFPNHQYCSQDSPLESFGPLEYL